MSRRKQRKAVARWEAQVRETSVAAARALALTIVRGDVIGIQAYDLGIVLNEGETAWQRVPAYYQYRGERTWTVQQNSRWGNRSTVNLVSQPSMFSPGLLEWLITDVRLAARSPDGSVLSIYWAAIEAVGVDLEREQVDLDAADGYHAVLRGPAIAPIAVATIACCYGRRALLDHPSLAGLRSGTIRFGPLAGMLSSQVRDDQPSGSTCHAN